MILLMVKNIEDVNPVEACSDSDKQIVSDVDKTAADCNCVAKGEEETASDVVDKERTSGKPVENSSETDPPAEKRTLKNRMMRILPKNV